MKFPNLSLFAQGFDHLQIDPATGHNLYLGPGDGGISGQCIHSFIPCSKTTVGQDAVDAVDALEQLKRRSNPFYSVKVVEALEKIRAK